MAKTGSRIRNAQAFLNGFLFFVCESERINLFRLIYFVLFDIDYLR